jgi:hypothetical protein
MPIVEAIWEDQDAPQPARPYVSLKVISGPQSFGDDEPRTRNILSGATVVGVAVDVTGQRAVTVSVNCFSDTTLPSQSAQAILAIGQASLNIDGVLARLREAGIAIWDTGAITNLDFVEESGWTSRAAMDLRIGLASNLIGAESVPFIENVEITGP